MPGSNLRPAAYDWGELGPADGPLCVIISSPLKRDRSRTYTWDYELICARDFALRLAHPGAIWGSCLIISHAESCFSSGTPSASGKACQEEAGRRLCPEGQTGHSRQEKPRTGIKAEKTGPDVGPGSLRVWEQTARSRALRWRLLRSTSWDPPFVLCGWKRTRTLPSGR